MVSVLTDFFWCVVGFLQAYNGAITALATAAIGIFTLVLVIVTRRQAILTKQSVRISERALVELERPFIFVHSIGSSARYFLVEKPIWAEGKQSPGFTLTIFNFGRTPGNIEASALFIEVSDEIPAEITKLHIVVPSPEAESVEIIIGQGTSFDFPSCACRHPFTHEHAKAVWAGTSHLYCHGFFTYRDIFKNTHTTKFCRRYVVGRDEWPPEGGLQRNSGD